MKLLYVNNLWVGACHSFGSGLALLIRESTNDPDEGDSDEEAKLRFHYHAAPDNADGCSVFSRPANVCPEHFRNCA